MNKRKKGAVTVESYCSLYDPNYGKQFAICGHGVVHLDGEACDCARQPGVEDKTQRQPKPDAGQSGIDESV
jgi:hypothetical protein